MQVLKVSKRQHVPLLINARHLALLAPPSTSWHSGLSGEVWALAGTGCFQRSSQGLSDTNPQGELENLFLLMQTPVHILENPKGHLGPLSDYVTARLFGGVDRNLCIHVFLFRQDAVSTWGCRARASDSNKPSEHVVLYS